VSFEQRKIPKQIQMQQLVSHGISIKISKMRKIPFCLLLLMISFLFACRQNGGINLNGRLSEKIIQNDTLTRSIVRLENAQVVLQVDLNGGAYFDFHLKDLNINPINWHQKDSVKPYFMGHFLCFDRWGPPTEAEKRNGFNHHGEAISEEWKIPDTTLVKDGGKTCSMMCRLPLGGLQLVRKIEMSEDEPLFFVTEEIKNLNKYGRMFNIVQHVSIAPPFLDSSTLFDNNAIQGFEDKEDGRLNQEEPVLRWPAALHNGEVVSLRQFQNKWPRVCTFLYDQNNEYAWITASNPGQRLLLGYLWKTREYPWINFWRSMEDGVPVAFGMEFGTTGLHEPFPVVAEKGKIFNQNIYDFIDADEVLSKSFIGFLAKIPEDYKGVGKIELKNSLLTIKEKNKNSRDIVYNCKWQSF